MTHKFIIGVLVAVELDGRLLFIKQKKGYWKGKWQFPGGRLEQFETVRECAVREVKEETNLDVQISDLIGIYDSMDTETSFEKHVVLICFKGIHTKGELKPGDDAVDARWLKRVEIDLMAGSGVIPPMIFEMFQDL